MAGYGTPTLYPYHPATGLNLPGWTYDPIASAESYFFYGNIPPLRLLVNGENQEKVIMAQQLAQQLGDYGLSVEIIDPPWLDYLNALQEKNFDLYLSEIYLTADFNISALLSSWGEYNYGQYYNSESDTLWEEFRLVGMEDPDWNFYQNFYFQMPIAPLCFKEGTALSLWGHLSQATPTAHHLFYQLEQWVVEQPQAEIPEDLESLADDDIIED